MSAFPARPEVQRLKPYVPGRPVADVQQQYGLADVVKLASNENPLGPSPLAMAAVREAVADSHIYPDGSARALRQALAARHRIPADWIMVGNGSDEILKLLGAAYVRSGDRTVVPGGSFPNYRAVSELFGAAIDEVPLLKESMDLRAMARLAAGARLIFLTSPNNPTGAVFSEVAFRAFMAAVPPATLVVVDQAYHEFDQTGGDWLGLLRLHENLILTRTFSKAYGLAGLRLGYGLGRPEVWQPLYLVREPFTVNALAQVAALAALEDREHLAATLANNQVGKAFLIRLCDQLGLSHTPSQANFLMIDLGCAVEPVCEGLLRAGVIVRPGTGFGRPNCIRVTIGTPEQNHRFATALRGVMQGQR